MKKSTKVITIIAAVLGTVGVGLSLGGLAMGATLVGTELLAELEDVFRGLEDFGDWDLDDTEFVQRVVPDAEEGDGETTVYDLDAADGMEIDLKYDTLAFYEYEESGIKIEVINDNRSDVSVELEGNIIKIEGEKKVLDRTVNVYYPKNHEFRHVGIEVDAGLVSMNEDFYAQELEVVIGAGELQNDGIVKADKLEMEVGAGSVEIDQVTVREIEAECGVGTINLTLTGKETDYNYQIECGMGEITINGDSYGGVSKEKSIRNNGASGTLQLECGMGNMEITFED